MKLNKLFLLAPVAILSTTSCAIIRHRVKIEEYIINYADAKDHKELDDNGDFNILQLSDIHMSVMDDAKTHYKFIQETINEAKAITNKKLHLIAISGDVFTFANKDTVRELVAFFEEQETPWTLTFGNHDEQGYFSIDWMTNYLTSVSKRENSNLLFRDFPNDDVFGSANFVIDLPESGTQHRQIVMIDSNRYNYGEGYGYDYIHHDQIDWYLRAYDYLHKAYQDKTNSLAFFHIPVPEYLDAYKDAMNEDKTNSYFLTSDLHTFENGEWVKKDPVVRSDHKDSSEGSPKVNTGFYSVVQELGYTKGFFVGHAHTNTNCMEYKPHAEDPNSVALCYGIKATDRVYMDENMMGGQLIKYHATAKEEGSHKGSDWFDLDLIYHKYADLKEGK